MPDLLLAWNEIHLQDARQVHGIPSSRIVVTGSPFFDKWFAAERLLQDRESFCRKVGLSPEAPFLLYLGSTSNIATDETWLVQELARALAEHPHPRLRQAGILVRPHPVNAGVYDQLRDERVRVWPRTGALPDSQETISDFYNSMRHAVAAAGINTTGMIDAVVNDLPCLTVMAEQYSATQRRAVHFQYLLNADVLEVTQSPEECVAVLEGLLRGEDTRRAKRREFTRAFARPRGLERPAGEVVAQAILMAARGATAAEIEKALELEADPSPALR